jgi:hypothetical protein
MKKRDVIFSLLGVMAIGFVLIALSKPRLKSWAESINCGNQMSSIGCGARIWAGDNSNRLADNFLVMSNELATPKVLICPSDEIRKPANSWAEFTTNNCSYEILRPGMDAVDLTNAYFRCPIHGHLGFADGTVFDGKRRRTKLP